MSSSGDDTTGDWQMANSKRKRAKSTITTKVADSGDKHDLLFTFDEEINEPVKTSVAPIETKKNPVKDLADSKIASIVVVTPKKRAAALKEENRRFIQPHSRKSKFANEINSTINDELEYFEEDIRKPKAPKVTQSVVLTTTPFEPTKTSVPVIIPIKPKKEKANERRKSRIPNPHRSEVGWVIKNSPTSPAPSPTPSPASSPSDSFGVSPKKGHPSRSLLEENGFEQQKYEQFRARCLRGILLFFFTFLLDKFIYVFMGE